MVFPLRTSLLKSISPSSSPLDLRAQRLTPNVIWLVSQCDRFMAVPGVTPETKAASRGQSQFPAGLFGPFDRVSPFEANLMCSY
jgi:hypothetical protein